MELISVARGSSDLLICSNWPVRRRSGRSDGVPDLRWNAV